MTFVYSEGSLNPIAWLGPNGPEPKRSLAEGGDIGVEVPITASSYNWRCVSHGCDPKLESGRRLREWKYCAVATPL